MMTFRPNSTVKGEKNRELREREWAGKHDKILKVINQSINQSINQCYYFRKRQKRHRKLQKNIIHLNTLQCNVHIKIKQHAHGDIQSTVITSSFAFSALTVLLGRQEGHPLGKKTESWSWSDWIFVRLRVPVCTAITSIISCYIN